MPPHLPSRTQVLTVPGSSSRTLAATAAVGFGLAGVLDVAVFHDVLQWHHFVASADPAAELRSDGYLLLALVAVTSAGVVALWRAARDAAADRRAGRVAAGGALVGAGVFNAADVLVDHLLLGLHRVQEGNPSLAADVAWLAASALLVAAGAALARSARAERRRAHARA